MFKQLSTLLDEEVKLQRQYLNNANISLVVRDIENPSDSASINADQPQIAASVIKVPVMVEVIKQIESGELGLDYKLEINHKFAYGRQDDVYHIPKGTRITVRNLLRYMILNSDNEATNILADKVGLDNINKRMASLNLKNTRISHLICLVDEGDMIYTGLLDGYSNTTSANDMTRVLHKIYRGDITGNCLRKEMIDLLECRKGTGQHLNNVNLGLIRSGIPRNVRIGAKTGIVLEEDDTCVNIAAVIDKKYSLVCMISDFNRQKTGEAEDFISCISRKIYGHYEKSR